MPGGFPTNEHFRHHLKGDLVADQQQLGVVVTDIRMPFWSMVVFMVKWTIAALPAILIVSILWRLSAEFFASLLKMRGVGY